MTTLAIWTVYKNPTDYPGKFVARRFDIDADGPKPSASVIIAPSLKTLRSILAFEMHLICMPRNEGDEPQIVETWL
jgi:hypothetical protein